MEIKQLYAVLFCAIIIYLINHCVAKLINLFLYFFKIENLCKK